MHRWLMFAVLLPISSVLGWAQGASTSAQRVQTLNQRLEQLSRSFPGKVGVFAREIETGREAGYNADEPFPMASTYKVAIMTKVFREADAGRLSLDERVTITDSDRRLGSGLLTLMKPGLSPTIYDLVLLMMSVSDNEATDLLLKRAGTANVNAMLGELGIKGMRVDRSTQQILHDWVDYLEPELANKSIAELLADPRLENPSPDKREQADKRFTEDPRDHAAPRAMTDLLTKIVNHQAASAKSCDEMLAIMSQQQFTDRIPRYLEGVRVAAKNGTIEYTTNDVGVIFTGKHHIALTVYTLKQNSAVTTQEAQERIGVIAREIYEYFEDTKSE